MSSRRHGTTASSAPRPPLNFSESLTIPKDARLTGTHSITIQAETVIHPKARFDSTVGSILIGRRCMIQEKCELGSASIQSGNTKYGGVTLGDYVVIESGAIIEAGGTEIEDGTAIQVACRIGAGARIGKNCTITSRSVIAPGATIPDNTVVYSNGQTRIDRRRIFDARKTILLKQINISRKMIPNALTDFVKPRDA